MSIHLAPPTPVHSRGTPRLRKPTVRDVPAICALIAGDIAAERVLPRSAVQITERLRDYTVAERDGEVVGVSSVALVDLHLAEVGVLTAREPTTAGLLLDWVLAEAAMMGVSTAFVLTDDPASFEAWGFQRTTTAALPEKRDRQCLRCPRLPRCRQVALVRALGPARGSATA